MSGSQHCSTHTDILLWANCSLVTIQWCTCETMCNTEHIVVSNDNSFVLSSVIHWSIHPTSKAYWASIPLPCNALHRFFSVLFGLIHVVVCSGKTTTGRSSHAAPLSIGGISKLTLSFCLSERPWGMWVHLFIFVVTSQSPKKLARTSGETKISILCSCILCHNLTKCPAARGCNC